MIIWRTCLQIYLRWTLFSILFKSKIILHKKIFNSQYSYKNGKFQHWLNIFAFELLTYVFRLGGLSLSMPYATLPIHKIFWQMTKIFIVHALTNVRLILDVVIQKKNDHFIVFYQPFICSKKAEQFIQAMSSIRNFLLKWMLNQMVYDTSNSLQWVYVKL